MTYGRTEPFLDGRHGGPQPSSSLYPSKNPGGLSPNLPIAASESSGLNHAVVQRMVGRCYQMMLEADDFGIRMHFWHRMHHYIKLRDGRKP